MTPSGAEPNGAGAALPPEIAIRQLGVTVPGAVISTTLASVTVAWQPDGFAGRPGLWLAALLLMNLLRFVLGRRWMRADAPVPSVGWNRFGYANTLLRAALWGSLALICLPPGGPIAESMLHLMLAIVALGLATAVAGHYAVFAVAVLLVLVPLLLRDLWLGGPMQLALAPVVALVGAYALLNGRTQWRMILSLLAERSRNRALLAELDEQHRRTAQALASAEAANAAQARLFAAVNHDLRQPLQAIALLAQTLQTRAAADDPLPERLLACVDGMDTLVDELLALARLQTEVPTPLIGVYAFDAQLREALATVQPLAQAKGLALHVDCPPVQVSSDRRLVARVLANLLANAVRYTPAGQVVVRARTLGRTATAAAQVEVEIEDSGIGIPAAEQSRIFQPLYQVGNPGRDRRQGLGLGLAIVHRIDLALGLGLTVDSEPGRGSRFVFHLPLAEPPRAIEPAAANAGSDRQTAAASAHPDPLAGHALLVLDDDADCRETLAGLLQAWGCDARAAADEREAHALLATGFRPEALLVDLRLAAGASGADAIARLRAALPGPPCPALLLTGELAHAAHPTAQARGLPVLAKPVKGIALRAFLGQALSQRRN